MDRQQVPVDWTEEKNFTLKQQAASTFGLATVAIGLQGVSWVADTQVGAPRVKTGVTTDRRALLAFIDVGTGHAIRLKLETLLATTALV